jgi:lysophospholipase L1-like esterase
LAVEGLEERLLLSRNNPAIIPAPSTNSGWVQHVDQLLAVPKGQPAVVFLGDSILDSYAGGAGASVWNTQMAPLNAINLAIGGSLTQNVLWEVDQGMLNGLNPKVVVLMIGINNLVWLNESPFQAAEGIQACVTVIHAELPLAQVFLLGLLPAGQSPYDPLRVKIAQTNQLLASHSARSGVRYADIGGWFVEADHSISSAVLGDYIHPTTWGYQLLTAAITPTLKQLLGDPPPVLPFKTFAVGDANGRVEVYTPDNTLVADFTPYGTGYAGPVSVAVGDINGDGYDDLVVAATTANPDVRIYDGRAFALGTFDPANPNAFLLAQFFPYALQFNVGANVAVGDIEHDGYADLVTGASAGNPDVRVYRGRDIAMKTFQPGGASLVAQFYPYGLNFNIGVNVAVGDVEHNGYADLVTGASAGNPDVRVYRGRDIAAQTFHPTGSSLLAQWLAYGLNFNVGAFVAVGDTTGSGYGDIITGASAGNPDVRVYRGKDIAQGKFSSNHPESSQIDQFFAFATATGEGVPVAAADVEHTGRWDILTGSTLAPHYRVVRGTAQDSDPRVLFFGNPPDLEGGIAVGS